MASVTEIANLALYKLGHEPITSIDDETRRAVMCKRFWPNVRDYVLRDHPWRCAMKRVELPASATAPVWGFDYAHQLPGDAIRVWEADIGREGMEWRVEGGQLLAQTTPVKIAYTYRLEDSGQYDAMLVDTMATRLAAEMSYPITNKMAVSRDMWQLYSIKLAEARTRDGQEGTPEVWDNVTLLEVR